MRRHLTSSPLLTTRHLTRPLAVFVAGLALAFPTSAHAFGQYRDKVAAFVQVDSSVVPCLTCHDNPQGGPGRNQPFFLTLVANGLLSGQINTVDGALEKIEASKNDSDGDAAPDLVEIKAGISPNDPKAAPAPDPVDNAGSGGSTGTPAGGSGGSGGSTSNGGNAGSSLKPAPPRPAPSNNDDDDDDKDDDGIDELGPSKGSTTATCSYSAGGNGPSGAAALLVAAALLSRVRTRRSRGSPERQG
jgi:hypothetical protein